MTFLKKHIILSLPLLAGLTACSWNEVIQEQDVITDLKTPIELSIGGVDSQESATRAVITTDPYNPLNYFDQANATKVFMIMKSTYGTDDFEGSHDAKYTVARGDVAANSNKVVFDANNQRYWDDAHARSSQLNIWAYAQIGMSWTSCTFEKDKAGGGYEDDTWDTSISHGWRTAAVYPFIKNWSASTWADNHQDVSSVMCQDLIFSNNLVDNSATGTNLGGTDYSLKFNFTTRKFPQEGEAVMKFYRAMSKITIKIIEGEGFDKSSTADFQFANAKNVKLSGFNTKGLFSIQQGLFQEITQHNEIPTIYLKQTNTSAVPYYTLEALTIPNIDEFMQTYDTPQHDNYSRFVSGKKNLATDVMMEFTIDNNKYQVTSGQLYDALITRDSEGNENGVVTNATKKTDNGTYIPLEAGKNYVFTFTIGKTKIKDITAQVAQWENVEAEPFNPSNARIKLQLEERGTPVTASVDIYRAADNASTVSDTWESYNWTTGYIDNKNVFKEISSAWKLENDWFWDNNMTYYHFRAIMPSGQTVNTDATPDPDEDYVSLSSAVSYTDVLWGAPMRDVTNNEDPDDFKFIYDKDKGFDVINSTVDANKSQIYQAIGPTEDKLKLTLFHMMSDLTFNIKTSEPTAADKVELCHDNGDATYTRTRVDLVGFYNGGKVLLGTGLVKTDGSVSTEAYPVNIPFNSATDNTQYVQQVYKFGAVPQDLTNVVLVITTPDHNQYKVAMKDVLATTVSNTNIANPYTQSGSKYIIDRWYPGFKYTYTFKLTKKGIDNIQATIVDWENVEAGDDNVQIQ